jgi:small subunit ribosomal protein S4
MIRKHKKFKRPKNAFDLSRINSENDIVKKYGLKNKKEIWKAKAKLEIIRNTAKTLIDSDEERQERFLIKLKSQGFNVKTTVDVLALTEEDILKRRLQTIVLNRKLATTPRGARQLITHKHVAINSRIVDVPSYLVPINEEEKIKTTLNKKIKMAKEKSEEPMEEIENA